MWTGKPRVVARNMQYSEVDLLLRRDQSLSRYELRLMTTWHVLTTYKVGKLKLEFDAISELSLHPLMRYGARSAVDDLYPEGKSLFPLAFLLIDDTAHYTHLIKVVKRLSAVITWYRLVHKHNPPFSMEDVLDDHPVDGLSDVPAIGALKVDEAFQSSCALVETSPGSSCVLDIFCVDNTVPDIHTH